jgi:hypothetical protein
VERKGGKYPYNIFSTEEEIFVCCAEEGEIKNKSIF